jgi:hypothetical protein
VKCEPHALALTWPSNTSTSWREKEEKRERGKEKEKEKEKETEGKEIYKDWKSERERGEMCCFSMTRTDLC